MNKGLSVSVAVLLLSGCSAPPFDSAQGSLRQDGALLRSAPSARSQMRATNVARFHYTGALQNFTVPSGVTQITVTADGASGEGSTFRHMKGGKGGLVKATIPVTSGETLAIFVGGEGGKSSASGGPGGFNGGGNGGVTGSGSARGGNGGGGASDVRESGTGLANRVVVAGGGGGAGGFAQYIAGFGGAGGGPIGGRGGLHHVDGGPSGSGGNGGSQTSGGKGGRSVHRGGFPVSAHGKRGKLGAGGDGGGAADSGNGGGGGGGGYYGGGGGSAGSLGTSGAGGGGGGGGASSYIEASATNVVNRRGAAPRGNGEIVITW
jgi:Glycine rich protein